jgi:hypothetical protein
MLISAMVGIQPSLMRFRARSAANWIYGSSAKRLELLQRFARRRRTDFGQKVHRRRAHIDLRIVLDHLISHASTSGWRSDSRILTVKMRTSAIRIDQQSANDRAHFLGQLLHGFDGLVAQGSVAAAQTLHQTGHGALSLPRQVKVERMISRTEASSSRCNRDTSAAAASGQSPDRGPPSAGQGIGMLELDAARRSRATAGVRPVELAHSSAS